MADNKFNAALDKLRIAYITTLKDRVSEVGKLSDTILQDHSAVDAIVALRDIAHKLAGSGKTFGLPTISDAGKDLELIILNALQELNNQKKLSLHTCEEINRGSAALIFLCKQTIHSSASLAVEESNTSPLTLTQQKPTVLIVALDEINIDAIIQPLSFIGYMTKRVEKLSDIAAAVFKFNTSAIIIQTEFNAKHTQQIQEAFALIKKYKDLPAIIYLCPHNDFDSRLNAIRLEGRAFLSIPFDTVNLIDQLGGLVEKNSLENCHVLIIDDDEILAQHYAVTLEKEGLTVTVLSNPKEALQVLSQHSIDLVLLDFNMPECNGFELALMLRQLDRYVRLPIIFLSAEANLEKLTHSSQLGVDDFLSKPITPEVLVKVVTNRVQRSLVLRKFMDQDSATGLLNHTRLKKELHQAVMRAERQGLSFCYALIDIDHFKRVNDTHGHGVGDSVIKTLAHLLKQRLRHTDIIGRYGGEEFGVILHDITVDEALIVLQQIHKQFGDFEFMANNQEFRVTFSAGLADYAKFKTDLALSQAADEALYKAKSQGRNRIVIAE